MENERKTMEKNTAAFLSSWNMTKNSEMEVDFCVRAESCICEWLEEGNVRMLKDTLYWWVADVGLILKMRDDIVNNVYYKKDI